MESVGPSRSGRLAARSLLVIAAALVVAYLVWTFPGVRPRPGFDVPFDGVLQGASYTIIALIAVLGAWPTRDTAWWLVAAAVVLRAVGFDLALIFLSIKHPLPYPSVADVAWVLSSVALIVALIVRVRGVAARLPVFVVMDAIAVMLLVLGVAISVLAEPIGKLSPHGTPQSAVVVNIGYPLLDMALLVAIAALVVTLRLRLQLAVALLVTGILGFAVVDIVYLVLLAEGRWRPGTLIASLSLVATAVIALAPRWALIADARPPRRIGELPRSTPAGVAAPAAIAVVAFVGLSYAGAIDGPTGALLSFAGGGVVAVSRGLLTLYSDRREAGVMLGAASADLQRFQALVEASTDFIGIADTSGTIIYINPRGRHMLGVDADGDVTSLRVSELAPGIGSATYESRWPMLLEQGIWTGEALLAPLDDDADPIPVAVSTFVIRDPVSHEPVAVASIQRDIREQLAAESALRDLTEQRVRLLTGLVQAQEDERARIAADVHDDPVQALAAVDLRLGMLRRRLAEDAPQLLEAADALRDTVTGATGRLRNLLFDLEPPSGEAGLGESLAEAARYIFSGTDVRWEVTGGRALIVAQGELVTAYRIAKEALTNARKHAGATRIVIDVQRVDDMLVVTVRDDGRGIEPGADRERPGHLGLSSMRSRAELAGGTLTVRRVEPHGTEVVLSLPTRSG